LGGLALCRANLLLKTRNDVIELLPSEWKNDGRREAAGGGKKKIWKNNIFAIHHYMKFSCA
jgi:hypothetical protein